jgi:DeoR/GlpR family transcriptional regulator of sugar metabolism
MTDRERYGARVLKEARLDRILDLVATRGQVTVAELNAVLRVSEATIRRDLDSLSQRGWVRRAHGGAVRVTSAEREPPLAERESALAGEKERIGRAAARMVRPGERIFLCSGTTVATMAPHLRELPDLTVITNSLPVINQLADRGDLELIVIGGVFRHTERSMISQVAEQMISEFRVDTVFMGVRALDPAHGLTADSIAEASTDRAILQIAERRVILADHSKFRRFSTVALAPLDAIHAVVTDTIDDELRDEVAAASVEVVVAT